MKAWVQRVSEASVTIDGERVAEIGQGYLVLLGVTHSDTERQADEIAERLVTLRIFEDAGGKSNLSIEDVKGSVIVVALRRHGARAAARLFGGGAARDGGAALRARRRAASGEAWRGARRDGPFRGRHEGQASQRRTLFGRTGRERMISMGKLHFYPLAFRGLF